MSYGLFFVRTLVGIPSPAIKYLINMVAIGVTVDFEIGTAFVDLEK